MKNSIRQKRLPIAPYSVTRPVSLAVLALAASCTLPSLSGQVESPASPTARPRPEGTGRTGSAELDRQDRNFLSKAHLSGMKEIELAQKGLNSSNPQVKAFAQMLITDHEKVARELMTLAQTRSVALENRRDNSLRKLDDKTGADLDEAFAEMAVEEHKEAIKLFEEAAEDSKDPDIRAFAARHLPALRTHLQHAEQLEKALD